MSSLIYERNVDSIKDAFKFVRELKGSENVSVSEEKKFLKVAEYVWKSGKKMHQTASEWGCKFVSIADFQKTESPFAGPFYNLEASPCTFMVVVFKGTSPGAMKEWIVGGTFDLESSSDKLGAGFAHKGFYTSLFPSCSSKQKPPPYLRIISAIKRVAEEWRQSPQGKAGVKMNLFVGGHSLGAGIASLFYARLLESPADLGEHITLRDAYCFGTPRACDSILASIVEHNFGKPINFRRTMWRAINKASSQRVGDIVTQCPPGMADARSTRSAFKAASFLSYAAIGVPVCLQPKERSFEFTAIPCGYQLNLSYTLQKTKRSTLERNHHLNPTQKPTIDPIMWFNSALKTFVPVLHDHFPGSYYESLDEIDLVEGEIKNNNSIVALNSSPSPYPA